MITASRILTGLLLILVTATFGCKPKSTTDTATGDADQTLMDSDNAKAIDELRSSSERFAAAIRGLSDEQLAFHESPERWSIAGVAEHLIKSEAAFQQMIDDALNSDAVETRPDSLLSDGMVTAIMADRSRVYSAPGDVQPEGLYTTTDEIMKAWTAVRSKTIGSLSAFDGDLRKQIGMHPAIGPLDTVQLAVFIAAHSDRHLVQIQQVKDDPKYPNG